MAEAARHAIEVVLQLPTDEFDITVCDYFLRGHDRARFVYPRPAFSAEEVGHHIARLLSLQTQPSWPKPLEVIIPVELWNPDEL